MFLILTSFWLARSVLNQEGAIKKLQLRRITYMIAS